MSSTISPSSVRSGYDALPGLLELLRSDAKHDPSAASTLDVHWVLYDRILDVTPETAGDPGRDRLLLSKGHGPASFYAVLAAKGFVPVETLASFGRFDSPLGHHPDGALITGVEIASGSLGHGLPIAVGRALGLRALGRDKPRVFCVLGDGELAEGSNHEAIALAGRLGLVDCDLARERPRRARASHHGSRARQAARRRRAGGGVTVETMRQRFTRVTTEALDTDPRLAVVLADIGDEAFELAGARLRHPHRLINVGIREQLMISVAGGLAQEGMRPVVHSYAPFLVERPFEQIKLDLGHQDVGALLVSTGASYDASAEGRTHQAPGDVALLGTLPGFAVHVPGHPDEVEELLLREFARDGRAYIRLSGEVNAEARPVEQVTMVREGRPGDPLVLAVGP